MNQLLAILILIAIVLNSQAQSTDTLYLNAKFEKADKELASYYRIAKPLTRKKEKFFVQTYYLNGQVRESTNCYNEYCDQMDGYYISFYENGKKEEEGERINNVKSGIWNNWYDNGQPKESGIYAQGAQSGTWKTWYKNGQQKEVTKALGGDWNTEIQLRNELISFWDSTGTQKVTDGSGFAEYYHEDTLLISEKGEFKKGFKTGTWTAYYSNGKPQYVEVYKNNEVKGVSWDKEGNEYKYNKIEDQPNLKGGMTAFYQHVGQNMKYPSEARRSGTQGRVYVQFFVDKDGQLTEVETVKGIGKGCDLEAERVIKICPNWNPGKQRGQPVKVRMVMPVIFRLG